MNTFNDVLPSAVCRLFILYVLLASTGCGSTMFGSSFSHKTTAPGMNRTEIRNQGMGTNDVQITENYTNLGGGYGAMGIGANPIGLSGSMVPVPAAPQTIRCVDGVGCNTIPYVENNLVRQIENQHRAIQNLRDIERCRAAGGSTCK